MKARNYLVVHARFRKAGRHGKTVKAQRRQDRVALQKEG